MELYQKAKEHLIAGRLDEAGRTFEFLLSMDPQNPAFLLGLATVFNQGERWPVAVAMYERALTLMPRNQFVLNDLAICYRKLGHEEYAQKLYRDALSFDPKDPITNLNMAGAYINWGEPEEALKYAERSLEAQPDNASAHHHKGIALLEMGRYQEGFEEYKWRQFIKEHNPRNFGCPEYDGTPVKTLVVHGEQGVGDEILFMGWLKNMKAEKIVIECTPRLVKTFERSLDAVCVGTPAEAAAHKPDAWIAMGTLPCFGLERSQNYIKPDPERVAFYKQLFGENAIGISWYGGTIKTHSYLRNAPLKMWQPLVEKYNCVSLQYGQAGTEAKNLGIPHFQESIDDIDELHAMIAACSLVICVNSTPVHMAGAMGIPCWTLTPAKPAWRYALKGEKMPFYDSVTQFRATSKDWAPVFKQIEAKLANQFPVSSLTTLAA